MDLNSRSGATHYIKNWSARSSSRYVAQVCEWQELMWKTKRLWYRPELPVHYWFNCKNNVVLLSIYKMADGHFCLTCKVLNYSFRSVYLFTKLHLCRFSHFLTIKGGKTAKFLHHCPHCNYRGTLNRHFVSLHARWQPQQQINETNNDLFCVVNGRFGPILLY